MEEEGKAGIDMDARESNGVVGIVVVVDEADRCEDGIRIAEVVVVVVVLLFVFVFVVEVEVEVESKGKGPPEDEARRTDLDRLDDVGAFPPTTVLLLERSFPSPTTPIPTAGLVARRFDCERNIPPPPPPVVAVVDILSEPILVVDPYEPHSPAGPGPTTGD